MKEQGVVEGPLDSECARGWIHNPCIQDKKDGHSIRLTLDTRPMADAVKTSHFPIPTPQELRHEFAGLDRFSKLDMNHSFFQFPLDEETKSLYTFYGPDELYRFNRLVQGASSSSSEMHERIRRILEGLEGAVQIKDDIVIHGKGKKHDDRLEAAFLRLEEYGFTLNPTKCELGKQSVEWFGWIFNKQGMSKDPKRVETILNWPTPQDKKAVKSFLQTVQFC